MIMCCPCSVLVKLKTPGIEKRKKKVKIISEQKKLTDSPPGIKKEPKKINHSYIKSIAGPNIKMGNRTCILSNTRN